ncbi:MAG: IS1634 family transposase, partial [Acidiferrobacterales bacterium]|nr:IS1634 family transposase [Acidiferrobacterales bacterium]
MFLRCSSRKKDGKDHRYWSIVENKRVGGGRVVQRHVLYLGEINSSQELAWRKSIEVFQEGQVRPTTMALFPEDRCEAVVPDESVVQVRLSELRLERPRQWGACWLVLQLWRELGLDGFWGERLVRSRKGTRWDQVLLVLVAYRLIAPGSEWRLHREWFSKSALGDLLGADFALAESHKLYACHDLLLKDRQALFNHLVNRWRDLFNASFEVLLYDLTSTYFESEPPFEGKRRFGYSRDKRPDCVQVVIALVVTPQGFPLGYEVLAGNTADKTTLREFLKKIEAQYGKAERIWVMDRGIPTEEVLEEMRQADPPVQYLVGTPKGRLTRLEKQLLEKPWHHARPGVQVKLLPQEGELYVLAQSADRVAKERAMRRRQLKWLWARLKQLSDMTLTREQLLMKLGAAKQKAPRAWRLIEVEVAKQEASFTYRLKREKLRLAWRREGRYLLRTNLTETNPAKLWGFYLQLVAVEEAFKNLKGDLAIRPIFHQKEQRIEAHIFVSFLAYCLHVTLTQRLRTLAPG